MLSANKTNGNNVNLFGDDTGDSYLISPNKKNNKMGKNEFGGNISLFTTEPAPVKSLPPGDSLKSKALVGNCPIKMDASIKNTEPHPAKARGFEGVLGSSGMKDCLMGANKS